MILVLSKALAINGFMGIEELKWLALMATSHKKIIELGTFLGRSTRALADNTPGMVLTIDDFNGPRDVAYHYGTRNNILGAFKYNLRDHLKTGKVKALKCDYKTIHEYNFDFTPDMIFIDGDHEYLSVKADIEWAIQLLGRQGLLCGHDANYPSIRKALNESIQYSLHGSDIWWADMSRQPRSR